MDITLVDCLHHLYVIQYRAQKAIRKVIKAVNKGYIHLGARLILDLKQQQQQQMIAEEEIKNEIKIEKKREIEREKMRMRGTRSHQDVL